VLADEPTGELDEKNEGIVLRSLADLRDRFESTIVVVTHSDRVAAACDRVVALQDGKVANGKGAR
jgi:putative ABC transport system ATP-binding protein